MDKKLLFMKYPASFFSERWREALPIGNGIIGASVYGSVHDERIMLTHNDLYWSNKTTELPDVSVNLKEIRKSLLAGDPEKAVNIMPDSLKKAGYNPSMGFPLPLADLCFVMDIKEGFKNYARFLDLNSGEACVKWEENNSSIERKSFISYPDNLLACKIISENPVSFNISLAVHETLEDFPKPQDKCQISADNNIIRFTCKNDDGTFFGAICNIMSSDGKITVLDNEFRIEDSRNTECSVKLFIKAGEAESKADEITEVLRLVSSSYDSLFKKHVNVFSTKMKSSLFSLGSCWNKSNEELLLEAYSGEIPLELLEKLWFFGRYLLISGSSFENPFSLYGLWCGNYHGHWSFNMVNENLEMIYWHAFSGNLVDTVVPVFDYMERYIDDFKTNAKNLYGCRGIYIPGPTVPGSGLLKHLSPHIIYWTGGAGWVAQMYYDYYLFTQDETFLKERAIPFMKEVATFYSDFFVTDKDGKYMTIPSNSPENTPGNYWDGNGMGESMETTMNATMDFAIAKEVLTNLVNGCEKLGIEKENTNDWKEMLSKIPNYQINEDGALKEWMHPFYSDNYHHRHESHLYPLFPGNEIQKDDFNPLYNACVKAIDKRLEIGINQQTGWSLAHMANNRARMEEGDEALDCLSLMARSCLLNNLFSVHNDFRKMGIGVYLSKAPVQLDAVMGLCSAINEMFVQSYDNTVKVYPALPKNFEKGTIENLLTRQGLIVSFKWYIKKDVYNVTIKNNNERFMVNILCPQSFVFLNSNTSKISTYIEKSEKLKFILKKRGN